MSDDAKKQFVKSLRAIADSIESGDLSSATLSSHAHIEACRDELTGMTVDAVYLGESIVIHHGKATDQMLVDKLSKKCVT